MKRLLAGSALALVSFALLILPAFAWNRYQETEAHSLFFPDYFWVKSIAAGESNGTRFTDYLNQWDHGVGSYGYPPAFYCSYSWTPYHFPLSYPVVVQTYSQGIVTDKFGEFVENVNATAIVYAT